MWCTIWPNRRSRTIWHFSRYVSFSENGSGSGMFLPLSQPSPASRPSSYSDAVDVARKSRPRGLPRANPPPIPCRRPYRMISETTLARPATRRPPPSPRPPSSASAPDPLEP